jgi:hypothetical protein
MPRRDRRRAPLAPALNTSPLLSSQLPSSCLPRTSPRCSCCPSRAAPSVRRSLRAKRRPLRPRPAYTRAPRRASFARQGAYWNGKVEPAETRDAGATSTMPVRFVMGRGTDVRAGKQAAEPKQSPALCATEVDIARTQLLPLLPSRGTSPASCGSYTHPSAHRAPRPSTLLTHSTPA